MPSEGPVPVAVSPCLQLLQGLVCQGAGASEVEGLPGARSFLPGRLRAAVGQTHAARSLPDTLGSRGGAGGRDSAPWLLEEVTAGRSEGFSSLEAVDGVGGGGARLGGGLAGPGGGQLPGLRPGCRAARQGLAGAEGWAWLDLGHGLGVHTYTHDPQHSQGLCLGAGNTQRAQEHSKHILYLYSVCGCFCRYMTTVS